MKEERKRRGTGYYLFIARVCPAAGEPYLKTSPPIKWKHRDPSERHEQNWVGCKFAFWPPPRKEKETNNADRRCEHPQGTF
jgi:hypothetical protein